MRLITSHMFFGSHLHDTRDPEVQHEMICQEGAVTVEMNTVLEGEEVVVVAEEKQMFN